MRRWIVLAMLIAGCDSKTPAKTVDAGPPPALPPLADLALTRQLDAQEYEKLTPPEPAPTLRWDLAANASHVLTLKQVITVKQSSVPVGVAPIVLEGYTQAEGSFIVEGRAAAEPGKARIRLAVTRQEIAGQTLPPEALKKIDPSICEYAVAADGALTRARVISGNAPQLIEVVYGLPAKPLAPGESEETPIDFPPTSGTYGYRGKATTKLLDWRRISRRECARLETMFDVVLVLPPGTSGSNGALRGRIIGYFCAAEGRFVQVEANITYSQRSAVQKPREKDPNGPFVWGIDSFDAESLLTARLK